MPGEHEPNKVQRLTFNAQRPSLDIQLSASLNVERWTFLLEVLLIGAMYFVPLGRAQAYLKRRCQWP
jgi:hypothetical protein